MGGREAGQYKGIIGAIGLFMVFVAGVFGLNFYMAERLTTDGGGVTLAGEQSMLAERLMKNLMMLEGRLVAGDPVEDAQLALRRAAGSFDSILSAMQGGGNATGPAGNSVFLKPISTFTGQGLLQDASRSWEIFKEALDPVLAFDGVVYAERSSEFYTPAGAEFTGLVESAVKVGSAQIEPIITAMRRLVRHLEAEAANRVAQLRLIQGGAVAVALALFVFIAVYFGRKISREERAASQARQETDNILKTVSEGLFLLDKNMNIGSTHSQAMERIFRKKSFADSKFERMLRDIVPEKTLKTALDFVGLLWTDRVNARLVKNLNPLSEVEVHFDDGSGGFETQYLQFDFNRVKQDGKLLHILVTVTDVTQRVLLARELEESQTQSKEQLDLLLSILHVEPSQLLAFLEDTDTSMKMVNTILKEPARDEAAFRSKLDGIFRQIHSMKGEAAALGLGTVEHNAHEFEELLNDMRGRDRLNGNDFLPLAVRLDHLFNHLDQVRDLVSRLAELRMAIQNTPVEAARPPHVAAVPDFRPAGDNPGQTANLGTAGEVAEAGRSVSMSLGTSQSMVSGGLVGALENLVERIAGETGKKVQLQCKGLGDSEIPSVYRKAVKEMAVQFVRNAVIHGIEEPAARQSSGKPDAGRLCIAFNPDPNGGHEMVIEDDGAGLDATEIRSKAVARGLIGQEEADAMDNGRAFSLIFRAGFSTVDEANKDAGRGVGLDLVRHRVRELGGRLRLSSAKGRRTEFRVTLPAADSQADVA
jgi:signal transduction histidine kinase